MIGVLSIGNLLDGAGRLGAFTAVPQMGQAKHGTVKKAPNGYYYQFNARKCEWNRLPISGGPNGCLMQYVKGDWIVVHPCC